MYIARIGQFTYLVAVILLSTSHLKFLTSSDLQLQVDHLAMFIGVPLSPVKAKWRSVWPTPTPSAGDLISTGRNEGIQD
jgi:hypothetical protein